MKPTACTVAVDVGNTAVKLGVRKGDLIIDHAIVIGRSKWETLAIDWVCDHLGCKDMHWRIASVHRRAAERLVDAVRETSPKSEIDLVTFRDVPMPVDVDHPERLGIDRLLSAYAARQDWDGPLVVVDAGSAVTVDLVNRDGVFSGGAILPGLTLQARVLATGTDALPQIEWSGSHQLHLPSKNTADAIYCGILVGVAAAIDGLTDRYLEANHLSGNDLQLVLTGGDSVALSPHIRRPHQQKSNLVCRGLLNLPVS